MAVRSSFGCSHCEIVEFRILKEVRKESSRVQNLDFSQTDFGLFKKLVGSYGTQLSRAKEVRKDSRFLRTGSF